MTSVPARFCAHADVDGDVSRCPCAAATPQLDVPLPDGIQMVGTWEDLLPVEIGRLIYGRDRTVAGHPVRVYGLGSQLPDGSIRDAEVCVADGEDRGLGELSPGAARELAAALLATADEVDGWTR